MQFSRWGIHFSRTPEQIEFNFNKLQQELESQIDEKMQQTRQKLLEHFDEEVQEKLRVSKRESADYLDRFENWLWQITRFYLQPYARFEDGRNAFFLTSNPFPGEQIHPGPYRAGRNVQDVNIYRVGHPLAQRIIECCKSLALPEKELAQARAQGTGGRNPRDTQKGPPRAEPAGKAQAGAREAAA